MAVKIRLKRMGKVRAPYYRIVVCDARTKRDGRMIEEIGTYNPKADPSVIHVDSERAQHWLGVGAQPSDPVAALLKVTGDWQKFKGEPAPEPMKVADAKRDKTEIFNEALKDAHGDPKSEAVTKKAAKPAKKSTQAASEKKTKADDAKADEAKADEARADEARADEARADEARADEAKADSGDAKADADQGTSEA
ncbi:MAG: 30S ribosomal protein S16 [Nocardioidaceae bacterium]